MVDRKEYYRKYNVANKAKKKAQMKAWEEANGKEYREKNKERIAVYQKSYLQSKRDGLFTVYLLPKENYVGQTECLYQRLQNHKNCSARDITDAEVLGKYATREEALAVEASYHAKGYNGFNQGI
jgi:hypothetical protein